MSCFLFDDLLSYDPVDLQVLITLHRTIAFAKDSETVIDAEFKAQPMDKEGTLILYTEDIDKTE